MTERQSEVLKFIKDFIRIRGFSPSYMDIATGLGMKSKSNIHRIIHSLREQGLIKMRPYVVRSITPTDNTVAKMVQL